LEGTLKRFFLPYLFLFVGLSYSQTLLLEENFDFTGLLTDNGWTAHSGAGTNPINTTAGLSYLEYLSSGVGNAALIDASGESVHRTFTVQSGGSVYSSFLINVSAAGSTYFINLGNDPIGATYRGRVFILSDGTGDFEIGLSQSSSTEQGMTNNNYNFSTTYLLVLKYLFVSGTSNDEVSLFVFDSGVPSTEPVTPTLGPFTGTDISGIGSFALRQSTGFPNVVVDGVRISDSWSQAPLPVELSSFSAVVLDNGVKLNWRTGTEVSNYGFEILRQAQDDKWNVLGFVEGHGNSNSPKEYSFIDENVNVGKFSYRLKQIDTDGQFEYSKIIEVDLGSPAKFELSQNYPNPFNPTTTIRFSLLQSGYVKLAVYNLIGEKVAELVNGFKEAGIHTINFNAENLNSGLYIYKIESNGFVQSRKMTLIK
jgi:hypothetical protein